jgi:hypothetical protein
LEEFRLYEKMARVNERVAGRINNSEAKIATTTNRGKNESRNTTGYDGSAIGTLFFRFKNEIGCNVSI